MASRRAKSISRVSTRHSEELVSSIVWVRIVDYKRHLIFVRSAIWLPMIPVDVKPKRAGGGGDSLLCLIP